VIGRYVFTPEIFGALDRITPGVGGELQLTDAIGLLLGDNDVYGQIFTEGRYDIGQKMGFLQANIELALDRPDVGPELAQYLRVVGRIDDHGRRGAAILGAVALLAPSVPRDESLGLVLAVDVVRYQVPPFANTAMDGYAARCRHGRRRGRSAGVLHVVGTLLRARRRPRQWATARRSAPRRAFPCPTVPTRW
jgi:hypothetical protein